MNDGLAIRYQPDNRVIGVKHGRTLLECALAAGIAHTHLCGGKGRCTTCRVAVDASCMRELSPRTPAEAALARKLGLPPDVRLACQAAVALPRTKPRGKLPVVRRLVLDRSDADLVHANLEGGAPGSATVGREVHAAVLFADLRKFTSFAERRPPYDVIYLLNHFYRLMDAAIAGAGGRINVCMGDGFLAIFEEDDRGTASARAVSAGLSMAAALPELNTRVKHLRARELKMGIGIHYGELVLGTIGGGDRVTAIGDTVNAASRIEAMTKTARATLLVSAAVRRRSATVGAPGRRFRMRLRGRRQPISLVEILPEE